QCWATGIQMTQKIKEAKVKINRVIQNSNAPPKQVNKVFWTRVGSDIQLDFGYFDLPSLREAINAYSESSDPQPVNLIITDRFVLSAKSALEIHGELSRMVDDLRENAMLPQASSGKE